MVRFPFLVGALFILFSSACLCFGQTNDVGKRIIQANKKLNSVDEKTRLEGAKELQQVYGELSESVRSLGYVLTNTEMEEARFQAACALELIGASAMAAVPDLVKALKDKSPRIRAKAADALGHVGPFAQEAMPALVEACKQTNAQVKIHVLGAIGQIRSHSEIALPALIQALRDKDEAKDGSRVTVAQMAAGTLGLYGPQAKEAVPELLKVLKSKDTFLRCTAMGALGRIKAQPDKVVPALRQALEEKEQVATWTSAARALGMFGKQASAAIPDLFRAYDCEWVENVSRKGNIREAVVEAFGAVGEGNEKVVSFLMEALQNEQNRLGIRSQAIISLRQLIPAKKLVPHLIEWLNNPKLNSYDNLVIESLTQLGELSVQPLIDNLKRNDSYIRVVTVRALGSLGPKALSAVPVLQKLAADNPKKGKTRVLHREISRALEQITR
jgi:HEAT repeat protein